MNYYQPQVETLGKFIRRIAIDLVRYKYWYYVSGLIPEHKDPKLTDQKLIEAYEINRCRVKRLRERRKGKAVVQYVRFGQAFILMATDGVHKFFEQETPRDIRLNPFEFRGYSIGVKGNTVCVQIASKRWKAITRQANLIALHNEVKVARYFKQISPFSFPGIVRQRRKLLNHVNQRRKRAGLPVIEEEEIVCKRGKVNE